MSISKLVKYQNQDAPNTLMTEISVLRFVNSKKTSHALPQLIMALMNALLAFNVYQLTLQCQ